MNLSIQVGFLAGTHIRVAYTEALELADNPEGVSSVAR